MGPRRVRLCRLDTRAARGIGKVVGLQYPLKRANRRRSPARTKRSDLPRSGVVGRREGLVVVDSGAQLAAQEVSPHADRLWRSSFRARWAGRLAERPGAAPQTGPGRRYAD